MAGIPVVHSDKVRIVFGCRYLKQIKEKKKMEVNHRGGLGKTTNFSARANIALV